MHPAFSVLFLTTFIGVGQGVFLALYTVWVYTLGGLLPAQDGHDFHVIGSLLALFFLGAGLLASFFHLGHPERAWRTMTRWRSSWLSREVIVLPVFMAAVATHGALHWFGVGQLSFLDGIFSLDAVLLVGTVTMILAFLLFLCTGMVYADVHLLQEWRHWLTVLNFTLLGAASGFMLATALAGLIAPSLAGFLALWAMILTLMATISRTVALRRNHHLKQRSSLRTAIGIRHHLIAQKAQGAMGGSFNTREFFHGHSPKFVAMARNTFLLLTFLTPILCILAAWWYANPDFTIIAFLVQFLGLLIERWYFFVQAHHPQNLYYQSVS